nr:retrovirus-related Pol polyprotein from transposon TNT 1-94 [Tanacetum cinerariifolium]
MNYVAIGLCDIFQGKESLTVALSRISKMEEGLLTELRCSAQCLIKDEDSVKRLRGRLFRKVSTKCLSLEKFESSSKTLNKMLDSQVNDKYKTSIGYHDVRPPYTGNFMPSKPDLILADMEENVVSEPVTSEVKTSVIGSSKREPKVVRDGAPIIEDWIFDSEDENETKKYVKQEDHNSQANHPRKNSQSPRDCDFYKKKMVQKSVWNNARRANHENFARLSHPHPKRNFVPRAESMKSGLKTLNIARAINSSTTYKSSNLTQTVNTAKGIVTTAGPRAVVSNDKGKAVVNAAKGNMSNAVKALACWIWRPKQKVLNHVFKNNSASTTLKRAIHSMKINGGYVAFGGDPRGGKITGKGKIRAGIENLIDHKVKIIRCDNETEFKNKEMNQFCASKGIKREFSVARTPQQNGVAERKNRTLIKAARTMLVDSKLPTTFWAKAVNTACYVQNRADEGFFIGYSVNSKAFKVFNSRTRIVEETLHITFLKNKPNIAGGGPTWLFDIDTLTKSMNYKPFVTGNQSNGNAGTKENIDVCQAGKRTVPDQDSSTINAASSSFVNASDLLDDPNMPDLEDIGRFSDAKDDVSRADMNNLDTYFLTLVDLPRGKRAIRTKWVYKIKKDERGIVVKNKARLVAQGHTQEEGIDYDEIFAPVARIKAIRLFLAYASYMNFIVYQMNVKSAFLYGIIEEEVYVCQPSGFEDLQFPDKVYKVEEALYGLHQAPRAWFQMSSIGELTFFLGLQVKQKKDGIFISQDKYVADILKKFDFSTVKTASTPMETNKALLKDKEADDVDVYLYRSMIGSLMYLIASRPDIMFAVYACARFQVTPKVSHLHAVKRIFRYLKGQPKLGLWYSKDSPFDLEAFFDSDYAGASLDRKSTTGGC